jgi:SSS family transporter
MTFTILDGIIVVAYLVGVAMFGVLKSGRQTSARDYFLSERSIPWWAACLAIVATETSALTFLSIPGVAYATDFTFLQLSIGYLLGRIVVAVYFLPSYFEGEVSTAYAFLERRFGVVMRRTASIVFMGTRTFADGVRMYTTAIPLAILLRGTPLLAGTDPQMFYLISIVLLSILTLVYVYIGGVRAVIWTDVIQLFIYIAGALIAIWVLMDLIPTDIGSLFSGLAGSGKLRIFDLGLQDGFKSIFTAPYTLLGGVIGGMFLSMASHGVDHLIIQRVLTTNSLNKARLAMVWSAVVVMVQFLLFLAVGSMLNVFYNNAQISPNEVFSKFIIEHIPTGLCGFIIAGILAAAMSTLSGSISSLSSATLMDLVIPLKRKSWSETEQLHWSRVISLLWCILLVIVASLFINTPKTVIELALSIASFTYGGLLGVFLLGFFTRKIGTTAAMTGFAAGIVTMAAVIAWTPISWTWYTLIGSGVCMLTAGIVHRIMPHGRGES